MQRRGVNVSGYFYMTINILLLNCFRKISILYFFKNQVKCIDKEKKTKNNNFCTPQTLTQECISNGCNA